jgi:hypothetical protein
MASDSIFGSGVLGTDFLPPSPAYPIQQLLDPNAPPAAVPAAPNSATQPASSAATATPADATAPPAQPGGLNVPLAPPAGMTPPTPPGQGAAWGNMPPIIGNALGGALAPQANAAGLFGPNTGRFMSALGAGLSSAGQNWNKPAAAAFASGAGAAIQGGDKAQQQLVHNQIAALNAAIQAFRAGDMIAYHRSLADYHQAIAEQRRRQAEGRAARPAQQPSVRPSVPADINSAAEAPPQPEPAAEAANGDAAAEATQPAAPDPQLVAAHRTMLQRVVGETGVPPDRIEAADLDGAAQLMATKALPAADAFETAAIHNALEGGHASPAEIDLIYGPGAADAIRSTATS